MPAPWEKYAAQSPAAGPWQKYGKIPPPAPPAPEPSMMQRIASAPAAIGETALSLGTGLVGGLAGGLNFLGTLAATGGNVDAAKSVQEDTQSALTYQPRGEAGQRGSEMIGQVMSLPGKLGTAMADPAQEALTRMGASPQVAGGVAAALATAPDAAVNLLGMRGAKAGAGAIADSAAAARATEAARPAPVARTPVQVARALNLKINPSDIKGAMGGSLIEGGSGSAKLKTRLVEENQPVITSHIREDLGLAPGPKLTAAELEAAKAPHNAKYQVLVETMPKVTIDANLNEAIAKAGTKRKTLTNFPEVVRLKKRYKETGALDTDAVLGEIQMLRDSGHSNMTSAEIKTTPNRVELRSKGAAQLDVANALEELIDRNAVTQGHAQLVPEMVAARRELAKINTAKRSLIGDDVSATMLKKMQDRGVPIEGRMKAIADVTRAHPDVMRDISKVKNKSAIGVLDVVAPTSLAVATGQPLVAAGILARPAGRSFVASNTYQNTFGKAAAPGQLKNALPQYFQQHQPRGQQSPVKPPVKTGPTDQTALDLQKPLLEPPPGQVGARPIPNNVTPITKHKVTVKADPDSGEIRVSSANGETIAQESGKYLQAKRSDTEKTAQRSGEGLSRYLKLAEEAERLGLTLASDFSVSPAQAALYAKLKSDFGFNVKKNPHDISKSTGNLVSLDPRVPVFEVTRKAASR